MSPQMWWYVTRAAGIVAWLMLSASVGWGLLLASGAFPAHRRPAWLLDLHRWLGALTVGFLALHLGALVADSYVHFGLADIAVPFASDWKPLAVAAGVLGMWSVLAVQVSSMARKRLPKKLWRGVHLASYPTFVLVALHGIFAGSDAAHPLYLAMTALTVVLVAGLLVYRVATPGSRRRGRRTAARLNPQPSDP